MNPVLRNRLAAVAGAGAIAIAGILGAWFEGDGPTVKVDGQTYHKVYIDPVGIATVCRGITGADVVKGKLYSEAECRALEEKHLRIAEAAVMRQIPTYPVLGEWIQAALIDFAYNLGEPALAGSTMRRLFNAGDVAGGCRELRKWVMATVNGKKQPLNGLVARRAVEEELCAVWSQQYRPLTGEKR